MSVKEKNKKIFETAKNGLKVTPKTSLNEKVDIEENKEIANFKDILGEEIKIEEKSSIYFSMRMKPSLKEKIQFMRRNYLLKGIEISESALVCKLLEKSLKEVNPT